MPQQAWSTKRERQYEHIKEGLEERGRDEDTAEEIAARTVNTDRARSGEAAPPAGGDVVDGALALLLCLAGAGALFVHRPGGDLLGGVLAAALLLETFLDVLVLTLTLGVPCLRHRCLLAVGALTDHIPHSRRIRRDGSGVVGETVEHVPLVAHDRDGHRTGVHLVGSSETRTSSLPKLRPASIPRNASGAASSPSTTSSR